MSATDDHAEILARARMAASMGDVAGLRLTLLEAAFTEPVLVLLAQALILIDQGRSKAAVTVLEAITDLPDAVQRIALVARSQALIGQQRPQEAVALLQGALAEKAQARPDLLATLARGFFQSGENDLAKMLLNAVIDVVPKHYESRYGMGIVNLLQGDIASALGELRIAQQVNPRRREPYQAIARAWRLIGRPGEGVEELEGLMAGNELLASPGLARELVELYAATGDAAQRTRWVRYLESNAELGPGHRVELGRHWLALKQAGALRRLLIGLRDTGESRIAGWLIAGMAEQLDQNHEKALAFYQLSAQERPEMWFAQERTARLLLDTGTHHRHAAPFVSAAVRIAPQTPEVQLVKALHAQASGEREGRLLLTALAHHRGVRAEVRERAAAALQQHG